MGCATIWLLLAIFELLVERTYTADALFSVLFSFKLEAHADLFKLRALKGKRVAALRLAVQLVNYLVIFKNCLVIVTLLRNPVVKGDDFSSRLSASNLDQVIHVEPALQDGM